MGLFRQPDGQPRQGLPVGCLQILQQDSPGNAVNNGMVQGEEEKLPLPGPDEGRSHQGMVQRQMGLDFLAQSQNSLLIICQLIFLDGHGSRRSRPHKEMPLPQDSPEHVVLAKNGLHSGPKSR